MPSPTAFTPPAFNLAAHALRHAASLGNKPALEIVQGEQAEVWSYARLEAAVRGIGTGLAQLGLPPGARILLRLGNSADFPLAYLGAIAAGFVPVPTSAALTAPEITRLAHLVRPALVLAGPGISLPDHPAPVLVTAALADMQGLAPCAYALGDADRLAYIVFTSGTSGQSLPVAHAHRALLARAFMHQGWEGLTATDRLLHAGAMNWTYTLGTGLLDPWTVGATALVPAPGSLPADLPALAARHGATILAGAPGIFRQMLKSTLPALPDLRHGLSAGEALPPALRAQWQAATGTDLHEALGLTECSTFLSGSPERPAPPGMTGFPQPGRRIAVLDETGQPLPAGQPGHLAVHRSDPGLMLGYLDAPDLTAERFRTDWFLTGDLVQETVEGALRHLGRADDILNPGGFRIAPQEVEAAMATCPGVTDCAVTEVEVAPGTRVLACAHLGTASEAALAAHAAACLARYKQPRLWFHLDQLPRNANMKLNRRALRAALQDRFDDPS
ncbi:class I adenylate-forming enzyme family protein [Tabrizicola oligotrophica]|uniref:Acyl--CoA ligase n=1 Tax=Tabrizicola oligotrophica TaxID=2710650 RepID=A0A6M0QNI1_9RHOB|nr:AMP-binding protein [Tabrizicola oligotrophica]NEY89010.1 acyl--CoA ligase [Tabrizicola oligotrophica]